MRTVKVVQLDSVNVAARTHYMPFYARLGPYDRDKLDRWAANSGELFEYWCHCAAWAPIGDYPLFDFRRDEMQGNWAKSVDEEHPGYIDAVYEEVAANGPMTISDLDDPGGRTGPWWGYGKGKIALEYLFHKGRVASYRGPNFVRVYDIPERVIPAEHLNGGMAKDKSHRVLVAQAAEALGVATAKDLGDYYRTGVRAIQGAIDELATAGELIAVNVEGWKDQAYLHSNAKRPRSISGRTLLSPFDSMVWDRARIERIFDFHYRIEIYVPEAKRQFGYYVLPFLLDGHLVARVDLKADRKAGRLLVQSSHAEPDVDEARVVRELAAELETFAQFLDLGDVAVRRNGDLSGSLRAAF